MNKLRSSFANMPWFTGKVGIDLGRNGSRPLDLNPRAGAKGGDNRRRRGPADGGAWPGAHRSRRSRRPGLDLARYQDGKHEYATANSIWAAARARTGGVDLAAAHGEATVTASGSRRSIVRRRGRTSLWAPLPRREAPGRLEVDRERRKWRRGGDSELELVNDGGSRVCEGGYGGCVSVGFPGGVALLI